MDGDATQISTVHVKEPLIRIELSDAACTCVDWANSERLAVGCSNGTPPLQENVEQHSCLVFLGNVLVYDLKDALRNPQIAKGDAHSTANIPFGSPLFYV